MVDKALETFRASDSADIIRDIGRESSSNLSRDLSDPAPHDIMRYDRSALTSLEGTESFLPSAIEHIFEGNRGGGYHYEGIENANGSVIPETRSLPNEHGVYEAMVSINGKTKKSSFFPLSMSPQEVVDAIIEANENKVYDKGNRYIGTTASGLNIMMFINGDGKIISSFPLY